MSFLEGSSSILALLSITAGLLSCFFGYRLFKIVLALVGFLCGALLVGSIATFITGDMGTVVLVVAIIGGALSAVSLLWAYYVGMFVVGAAAGAVVGSALGVYIPGEWIGVAVVVGCALVCGILAIKIQHVVLAVSTAILGSAAVVTGAAYFLLGGDTVLAMADGHGTGALTDWRGWAVIGVWILVSALGCSFQLGGRDEKEKS